ncbi:DUF2000 family protein [Mycolicibacterium vaccae]|uniref:DUF2000 family protein n=1 Tax=Mycolicibacterium vaccae TaxID=1810 RepID=UPI003CF4E52D
MTDQLERDVGLKPTTSHFVTKIALVVRDDLEGWQKLNVAAFLASGVAAASPELIGRPYRDADGTCFTPMFGQPVMVFAADSQRLARTLSRALSRDVVPTIFTMELFGTSHDDANRAAVAARSRDRLDLAGIAVCADRKVVDKIVDGLRLHQ